LGYRAGLTVDTLDRTELESNTGNDTSPLSGGSMNLADIRANVALLKGVNVQPKTSDGKYIMIAHPYVTHDIKADNTSGGFIDVMKYADASTFMRAEIGSAEGARILESTNVGTSGSAPNVLYAAYIVGTGAIGAVSLAGRGPMKPVDARNKSGSGINPRQAQAFRVNVITPRPGGEMSDPEGKIGSAISYYFIYVSVLLDETTLRYRTINADATII
jgi:N4-gp56 family major capsid protein